MVEDMKGKIRVYTRVRPMSRSELDRVSVWTHPQHGQFVALHPLFVFAGKPRRGEVAGRVHGAGGVGARYEGVAVRSDLHARQHAGESLRRHQRATLHPPSSNSCYTHTHACDASSLSRT